MFAIFCRPKWHYAEKCFFLLYYPLVVIMKTASDCGPNFTITKKKGLDIYENLFLCVFFTSPFITDKGVNWGWIDWTYKWIQFQRAGIVHADSLSLSDIRTLKRKRVSWSVCTVCLSMHFRQCTVCLWRCFILA